MKITTLVENTSISQNLGTEHGLCMYIEAFGKKILFDTGASSLFISNAAIIGVKIEDIDICVISHGHHDHGGGLKDFINVNSKAQIYVNKEIFGDYYSLRNGKYCYNGLNKELQNSDRLQFVGEHAKICEGAQLFSAVNGRELFSSANSNLMMKNGGEYEKDKFVHEQNLIVTEGSVSVLFSGCAHNGILNIIERFKSIKGKEPDYALGGFHLYNPNSGISESEDFVKELCGRLKKMKTIFYTCHCTGDAAYKILKAELGEKIGYAATGSVIEIHNKGVKDE